MLVVSSFMDTCVAYIIGTKFVSNLSFFVFCQISYFVTRVYFRKLALEASDLVLKLRTKTSYQVFYNIVRTYRRGEFVVLGVSYEIFNQYVM